MDLTNDVHRQYASATGPFSQLDHLINGSGPFDSSRFSADPHLDEEEPRSKFPDCLGPSLPPPTWKVFANFLLGRRWVILPDISPLHPLLITVRIPSHSDWPQQLLKPLQASASFHTSDSRVANLGISCYLAQVLTAWSARFDDFPRYFNSLPFGSEILVEEICVDLANVNVRLAASMWEDSSVSVDQLQKQWQLPPSSWPKIVDVKDLELLDILNENVALVRSERHFGEAVIFKSSPSAPAHIYHELRMLLTLPSSPHLVKPPLALVSIPDLCGRSAKIVGFILHYYSGASLARTLHTRMLNGTLEWHDQLRWARQVTSTLMFLNTAAQTFYSDLKPDNILLSPPKPGEADDIVLIDFEQNGAPNAWTAPEVIHIETLNLLSRVAPDPGVRESFRGMLVDLIGAKEYDPAGRYQNPSRGYHIAWPHLSASEREAAEVFALGKVLYCIFEGVESVTTSIMTSRPVEQELQFPHFIKTPPILRDLILACTFGAREHDRTAPFVVRVGNTLFPRGKSGLGGEPLGSARDVVETSQKLWMKLLTETGNFWAARTRLSNGIHTEQDLNVLSYLRRPTLNQVLCVLNSIDIE
ncbi:serine/threonine protein kinase [Blastomyces percursus]|uniref:Serine/threonine protein kinase n=1 Tax=Blastomyces percursus TaxID=1658174 RepID=A0A1J9QF04_9EURO|nr:serine/threonine protein kinase [Blastomyces percursus]